MRRRADMPPNCRQFPRHWAPQSGWCPIGIEAGAREGAAPAGPRPGCRVILGPIWPTAHGSVVFDNVSPDGAAGTRRCVLAPNKPDRRNHRPRRGGGALALAGRCRSGRRARSPTWSSSGAAGRRRRPRARSRRTRNGVARAAGRGARLLRRPYGGVVVKGVGVDGHRVVGGGGGAVVAVRGAARAFAGVRDVRSCSYSGAGYPKTFVPRTSAV